MRNNCGTLLFLWWKLSLNSKKTRKLQFPRMSWILPTRGPEARADKTSTKERQQSELSTNRQNYQHMSRTNLLRVKTKKKPRIFCVLKFIRNEKKSAWPRKRECTLVKP